MKRAFYFFALLVAFLTGCCTSHSNFNTTHELSYQDRFKEKLVQHLENSTVVLLQKNVEDKSYSSICAGVWITQTKFLTARHCPENEIQSLLNELLDIPPEDKKLPGLVMPYKTHAETKKKFKLGSVDKPHFAVVIAYDPKNDLALFDSIDIVDHDIASIYYKPIYDGQNLLIVGHTTGMEYTIFPGMVSKDKRMMEAFYGQEWETLQISAPVAGGNSGGGAFDMEGNLLGICSFTRGNPSPNQAFFIHRDSIIKFLQEEQVF